MKILFPCSNCPYPGGRLTLAPGDPPRTWQCPACDNRMEVQPPASEAVAPATCLVCGNHQLYKKKDFPHWLGLTILVTACLAFLIAHGVYALWWAWAILLGSAALDGLLYLWVGDLVVCYRCGAHFRGAPPTTEHQPFELIVGERYRQERIRREELGRVKSPEPGVESQSREPE